MHEHAALSVCVCMLVSLSLSLSLSLCARVWVWVCVCVRGYAKICIFMHMRICIYRGTYRYTHTPYVKGLPDGAFCTGTLVGLASLLKPAPDYGVLRVSILEIAVLGLGRYLIVGYLDP